MNEGLKQALMDLLGDRFSEDGAGVVASPRHERELEALLRVLRERGGRQHHGVRISRRFFDSMGRVDAQSGVVEVGAGVSLQRLEQELRLRDFSLRPLSPGMLALDLAAFLEGPYAGLRAVPGGRLEPVALALSALMPDGLRYASRPSPRSAAGPDLDALFLGAEGRFGLVLSATLRLFTRPRAERTAVYSFHDRGALLNALRAAIGSGCWLRRVHLWHRSDRAVLACEVIGSPEGVERDLSTLGHEVFSRGGRSSGQQLPAALEGAAGSERELSWPDVAEAFARGEELTLWRVSLESVIVSGAVAAGLGFDAGQRWSNADALSRALAAADAQEILGGTP